MLPEIPKIGWLRISILILWAISGSIALIIQLADIDQIIKIPPEERGVFISGLIKVVNHVWGFVGSDFFIGLMSGIVLVLAFSTLRSIFSPKATEPPGADDSRRKPNYDAWDHVDEFTLQQAAYLWAEIEPGAVPINSHIRSWRTMLIDAAAVRKDLKVNLDLQEAMMLNQGATVVWPSTRVSRKSLKEFAIQRNQYPRFLFPNPDEALRPNQAALDELAEMLQEGVQHILNKPAATPKDVAELAHYADDWNKRLFALMDERFTKSDAIHVKTLGVVPVRTFTHVNSDADTGGMELHTKILREFAVRQERISDLIKKGPARK